MASNCTNPYCPRPEEGMRQPTSEEIARFREELDQRSLDILDRREITVQIYIYCGTWVTETWDSQLDEMVRGFIATPFRFSIGDRVKITLKCNHHGMEGVVTRRMRWAKTIMPPPPPENLYYIVFEDSGNEYGYEEADITRSSTCDNGSN